MKKLFAALLAMMMVVSMATIVSAETTTLTTSVPAAEYVLNVPKTKEIAFGATSTNIGNVTVSGTKGFAEGKDLEVTLTFEPFSSDGVTTTIPFLIKPELIDAVGTGFSSGTQIVFRGQDDGTTTEKPGKYFNSGSYYEIDSLYVEINSEDWGKALAGEYTTVITFTAEVVVE